MPIRSVDLMTAVKQASQTQRVVATAQQQGELGQQHHFTTELNKLAHHSQQVVKSAEETEGKGLSRDRQGEKQHKGDPRKKAPSEKGNRHKDTTRGNLLDIKV